MNNRQRRADKRRRRQRPATARRATSVGAQELAECLVLDAAEAAEHGDSERLECVLRMLVEFGRVAGSAMTASLIYGLQAAWENGWQPADVVRAARTRLGAVHAGLAVEMIIVEAQEGSGSRVGMPEAWAAQLGDVERDGQSDDQRWAEPGALQVGAGLLGMLTHLPELPHLLPPPSKWGRRCPRRQAGVPGEDRRVLDKVRALLAKAESTEFDDEADALTAKAQELMARHSIDQAMIAGEASAEVPDGRRIGVDDPYAQGKATLLAAIAGANHCRSVWMTGYGFSTVVGFSNDVDSIEVLYISLLVQATRAMTTSGAVRDRTGRSRTRSFRQSFMFAFARRIGERLEAATQVAVDEATDVHGSRLLPVLAGRTAAVDEAFEAMFPDLIATSARISNLAGWAAGRAAADLAHLGPHQSPTLPGVAL